MNLQNLCSKITKDSESLIYNVKKNNRDSRVVCLAYSPNFVERKKFPKEVRGDVFAVCWTLGKDSTLYGAITPRVPKDKDTHFIKFNNGDVTQLHTHDYIELGYVISGSLKQKILGKSIKFQKGELVLLDKNCIHQDYLISQDANIIFIGMSNKMFDEAIVEKLEEEKVINFLKKSLLKQKNTKQYLHFKPKDINNKKIEESLISLVYELQCNDESSRYISKGLVMRILNLLSTEYTFSLSLEQKKTMNSFVVDEIKEYINCNYAQIKIKDLVDRFHFNEDYFNRILKEKEGVTYSEYVQNVRLKEAVKLLANTDISIQEIASMVGYNNKGYFYKLFSLKYGVTPAMYKKIIKN
ncbi:MAG: AraC family transcriptional regulator [Clostridium perfringens]|nr:AraC family transcriptional regulator [Clostridium perfringens]